MEAPKRKQDPRLMISKTILKQLPEHVIPAIANGLQVDADRRTSSFSRFSAELSAEPTVMAKIVETETVRSLPTNTKRSPHSHNLPPFPRRHSGGHKRVVQGQRVLAAEHHEGVQ